MFFLNFGAGEFFALLGTVGGLITALYLLDRSKRKRIVSTLRFWTPAPQSEQQHRRKSVQEPWSLLLQLLSLALILLALAQLVWGTRGAQSRNHVLLLDVSSATAQQSGDGTILQREKSLAREYLSRMSRADSVMVIRADDLATPVTPFTKDQARLETAINESPQSYSALDLDRALSYAQQAQKWSDGAPGELVYFGPKRVRELPTQNSIPAGLRVISVDASKENCGISGMEIARGEVGKTWRATVRMKNYGSEPRAVRLLLRFENSAFSPRNLTLRPAQEATAEFEFVTNKAGRLAADIEPRDALPLDDHASVVLPDNRATRVYVVTNRPEVWRPLLGANSHLDVRYLAPSQYEPSPGADLLVLDQVAPPSPPKIASLWVNPPKDHSPVPVTSSVTEQVIQHWNSDTELGTGLRTKDFRLAQSNIFRLSPNDFAVASVGAGAVVVVRPAAENHPKVAVTGFDLLSGHLRFEVAGPLLFANLVRWLTPEAFRTLELSADQVGLSNISLDGNEHANRITVADENGRALPFTVQQSRLQFYVDKPTTVHVTSDQRERILSMVLPEVPEYEWKPASTIVLGMPASAFSAAAAVDLWKELAGAGAVLLIIEWLLYGRQRKLIRSAQTRSDSSIAKKVETKEELVSR